MKKIFNWIKDHILIIILVILGAFILLGCFGSKVSNNTKTSIPSTSEVKRLSPNSQGNLVSDNLLNIEDKSLTTTNGITYFISNGVITLNGTATSTFAISLYQNLNTPINTVLCAFNSVALSNNLSSLWVYNSNFQSIGALLINTVNNSKKYTESIYKIELGITTGATFTNFTLKPMLVEGTTIPTTFEPYGQIYYSETNYDLVLDELNQLYDIIHNYEVFASSKIIYTYYSASNAIGDPMDVSYSNLLFTTTGNLLPYDSNGVNMTKLLFDNYLTDIRYRDYFKINIKLPSIYNVNDTADFDFNCVNTLDSNSTGGVKFRLNYYDTVINGEDMTLTTANNVILNGYGSLGDYKYNSIDIYLGTLIDINDYVLTGNLFLSTFSDDYLNGYLAGSNASSNELLVALNKIKDLQAIIDTYGGHTYEEIIVIGQQSADFQYGGQLNVPQLMNSIFHGPLDFINGMLSFDLPGTSIKVIDICKALFTITLVFIVIKFLKGN